MIKNTPTFLFVIILFVLSFYPVAAQQTVNCPSNAVYWERWYSQVEEIQYRGYWRHATQIAVNSVTNRLAVLTKTTLTVYDAETLEQIIVLANDQPPNLFLTLDLSWAPDGQHLVVSRAQNIDNRQPDFSSSRIDIWNVQSGEIVRSIPRYATAIGWSPDSSMIAVADWDGLISFVEPERAMTIAYHDVRARTGAGVDALTWSPDSSMLAASSGKQLVLITIDGNSLETVLSIDDPLNDGFDDLAWSRDGALLALGGFRKRFWVWNVANRTFLTTLEVRDSYYNTQYDMEWSPDGSWLARGTVDGFNLWNVASGETYPTVEFNHQLPPFVQIEWLPDSQHLISVDFEGSIYRWDTTTGCVEAAVLSDWQPTGAGE